MKARRAYRSLLLWGLRRFGYKEEVKAGIRFVGDHVFLLIADRAMPILEASPELTKALEGVVIWNSRTSQMGNPRLGIIGVSENWSLTLPPYGLLTLLAVRVVSVRPELREALALWMEAFPFPREYREYLREFNAT